MCVCLSVHYLASSKLLELGLVHSVRSLSSTGSFCSSADPPFFIYRHGGQTLLLLLYADDTVSTGSSSELMLKLIHDLSEQFSI